ncbi:mevalonate kinase [Nocardia brasiliensis]|uniref:mevalonate kinase n=1 Tax=Nocardia brasiliensis TaxID=37326 RepID=UPI0024546D6C|nr:mevalonate kinase [Nocardia brasiliensis]
MFSTEIVPMGTAGTGRASGKAILIGEHTVIYGLPAIALPLPDLSVQATVRLTHDAPLDAGYVEPLPNSDRIDRQFTCTAEQRSSNEYCGVTAAVAAALRRWGCHDKTVQVCLRGNIPPARGLGASAACAAAAVRAVAELLDAPIDAASLFELVQCGEQVTHGHASGIDTVTVTATGPIRFEAGVAYPITEDLDAAVIIADTGIAADTQLAVNGVRELLHRDRPTTRLLLTEAERIIEFARRAFTAGDRIAFGASMVEFHSLLVELGVSTPMLDRLVTVALSAGASGAKLTGAGLGGCMLALTGPDDVAAVDRALRAAGAHLCWVIPIRRDHDRYRNLHALM